MIGSNFLALYIRDPTSAKDILQRYRKKAIPYLIKQGIDAAFYCSAMGRWQRLQACVICERYDSSCNYIPDGYKGAMLVLDNYWSIVATRQQTSTMEDLTMGKIVKKKKKKKNATTDDNGMIQAVGKAVKDALENLLPGLLEDALIQIVADQSELKTNYSDVRKGIIDIKTMVSGMDTDIKVHKKTGTEKRGATTASVKKSFSGGKAVILQLFTDQEGAIFDKVAIICPLYDRILIKGS